jgi:hypothetical protein
MASQLTALADEAALEIEKCRPLKRLSQVDIMMAKLISS